MNDAYDNAQTDREMAERYARHAGRPRIGSRRTLTIADDLWQGVEDCAVALRCSRSEVVRRALAAYLDADENDDQLAEWEGEDVRDGAVPHPGWPPDGRWP